MPSDIVTPPTICHIAGCSGEIRLESQAFPIGHRVTGKTERIPVSTITTPAGEDKWSSVEISSQVIEMQMVQPPKRVKTRQSGFYALLPIDPPEINTHRFVWVVQDFKVGFRKISVSNLEFNRLLKLGIYPQSCGHFWVHCFMRVNAFCRVQVQGGFQTFTVQECDKPLWIGEEILVPGITCPSAAFITCVGYVPIHIHDAHR